MDRDLVRALGDEQLTTRTFQRLDERRQVAVIAAVLDEAFERGPADIRIKEVAAKAGVSVGSIYQYFGDREGLVAFTLALCGRQLAAATADLAPALVEMPLADGIRLLLEGGLAWCRQNLGVVRVFLRGAYQGDPVVVERLVVPYGRALHEAMRNMIAAAQRRGEVRADVDPDIAARVVTATGIAIGDSQLLPRLNDYYRVTDETVPLDKVIDQMVDMVERGLC